MPKTIESRSLSAPPAHLVSPKTPNRTVHPLSQQVFSASEPPAPQPKLPLKHSWRRQWSKNRHLDRAEIPDMHVVLDARMSLASLQITTSSNRQQSVSSNQTTPEPSVLSQTQSVPPGSAAD